MAEAKWGRAYGGGLIQAEIHYGDDPPERPKNSYALWRNTSDGILYELNIVAGRWQSVNANMNEVATQAPTGGGGLFFPSVEAVPMSITYGFEYPRDILITEVQGTALSTPTGTNNMNILSGGSVLNAQLIGTGKAWSYQPNVVCPANTNLSFVLSCTTSYPAYNLRFFYRDHIPT